MIRKSLIALAAVASLAGFTGSQANATSLYLSFGHNGYGYDTYIPVTHKCFYKIKRVKVVKWIYGEKVVVWKKIRVKVCPSHYGY